MILGFDVETTGLPIRKGFNQYHSYTDTHAYDTCRIVQLAFASCDTSGNIIQTHNYIIKPKDWPSIDPQALELHGITTKSAEENGTDFEEIVPILRQSLQNSSMIVAHNAEFDKHVLASECYRRGFMDVAKTIINMKTYCTMYYGAPITKLSPVRYGRYKYPKLSELYKHYFGTGFEGEHNAMNDVKACLACYTKMNCTS